MIKEDVSQAPAVLLEELSPLPSVPEKEVDCQKMADELEKLLHAAEQRTGRKATHIEYIIFFLRRGELEKAQSIETDKFDRIPEIRQWIHDNLFLAIGKKSPFLFL